MYKTKKERKTAVQFMSFYVVYQRQIQSERGPMT